VDLLDEPHRPSTLRKIFLFPLQALRGLLTAIVGIGLWIAGVWLSLLILGFTIGVPLGIGLGIFHAIFDGGGGEQTKREIQPRTAYVEQVSPSMDRAVSALANLSKLADEHALIDFTKLSMPEVLALVQDELDAARAARQATSNALTELQRAIPPEECQDAHVSAIEFLQLTEQGLDALISYMSEVLRSGTANEASLERGNSLLAEADRVKAASVNEAMKCFVQPE